MNHRVGLPLVQQLLHSLLHADVAALNLHFAQQVLHARFQKILVVAGERIDVIEVGIKEHQFITLRKQYARQVRANKSAAAGNENFLDRHYCSSSLSSLSLARWLLRS